MSIQSHPHSLHVLIAGGGVAALEAMTALRALAGDRVRITLLAPEHDFRYRPMTVAEPFTIARRHVALAGIAGDFGTDLVTDALVAVEHGERRVAVEHGERRVVARNGQRIGYDALVVACGTRQRPAFGGAITLETSASSAPRARRCRCSARGSATSCHGCCATPGSRSTAPRSPTSPTRS